MAIYEKARREGESTPGFFSIIESSESLRFMGLLCSASDSCIPIPNEPIARGLVLNDIRCVSTKEIENLRPRLTGKTFKVFPFLSDCFGNLIVFDQV